MASKPGSITARADAASLDLFGPASAPSYTRHTRSLPLTLGFTASAPLPSLELPVPEFSIDHGVVTDAHTYARRAATEAAIDAALLPLPYHPALRSSNNNVNSNNNSNDANADATSMALAVVNAGKNSSNSSSSSSVVKQSIIAAADAMAVLTANGAAPSATYNGEAPDAPISLAAAAIATAGALQANQSHATTAGGSSGVVFYQCPVSSTLATDVLPRQNNDDNNENEKDSHSANSANADAGEDKRYLEVSGHLELMKGFPLDPTHVKILQFIYANSNSDNNNDNNNNDANVSSSNDTSVIAGDNAQEECKYPDLSVIWEQRVAFAASLLTPSLLLQQQQQQQQESSSDETDNSAADMQQRLAKAEAAAVALYNLPASGLTQAPTYTRLAAASKGAAAADAAADTQQQAQSKWDQAVTSATHSTLLPTPYTSTVVDVSTDEATLLTPTDAALLSLSHALCTSSPFLGLSGIANTAPLHSIVARSRVSAPNVSTCPSVSSTGAALLSLMAPPADSILSQNAAAHGSSAEPAHGHPLTLAPLLALAPTASHFVDMTALALAAVESKTTRAFTHRNVPIALHKAPQHNAPAAAAAAAAAGATADDVTKWEFAPLPTSSAGAGLSTSFDGGVPIFRPCVDMSQRDRDMFLTVIDITPAPRQLLTVTPPLHGSGGVSTPPSSSSSSPQITVNRFGGYTGGALEYIIHQRLKGQKRAIVRGVALSAPYITNNNNNNSSNNSSTSTSKSVSVSAPSWMSRLSTIPLPVWRLERMATTTRLGQMKNITLTDLSNNNNTAVAAAAAGTGASAAASASASVAGNVSGSGGACKWDFPPFAPLVSAESTKAFRPNDVDVVLAVATAGAGPLGGANSVVYTVAECEKIRQATANANSNTTNLTDNATTNTSSSNSAIGDVLAIPSSAYSRPSLLLLPTPTPALVTAALSHLPPLPTLSTPLEDGNSSNSGESNISGADVSTPLVVVDESQAAPRRLAGALLLARCGGVLSVLDTLLSPDAETNMAHSWLNQYSQQQKQQQQQETPLVVAKYPSWVEADARIALSTLISALSTLRQGGMFLSSFAFSVALPCHVSLIYLCYRLFARLALVPAAAAADAATGPGAAQAVFVVGRELRQAAPAWALEPLRRAEKAAHAAAATSDCSENASATGGNVSVAGTWFVPPAVIFADVAFLTLLRQQGATTAAAEAAALTSLRRGYLQYQDDICGQAREIYDKQAQANGEESATATAAADDDVSATVDNNIEQQQQQVKRRCLASQRVLLPVRQVGLEQSVANEVTLAWGAKGTTDQ